VLLRFVIYRDGSVQKRNIFALAVRDQKTKKKKKLLERCRCQQGGWKWQLAEKIRTSNCAEQTLRFDRAEFHFYSEQVYVKVNPPEINVPLAAFSINVDCRHLGWQVSSVAHIFNALSQILSAVEHLTLAHKVHSRLFEEHNEVDRTEWRKLLRSVSNVKTLRVHRGLVGELSRCLQLEDGEHPLDLLPELQELAYPGSSNADGAFTPFIDVRQNAGSSVTLIKW
jgi:hypothetical protein